MFPSRLIHSFGSARSERLTWVMICAVPFLVAAFAGAVVWVTLVSAVFLVGWQCLSKRRLNIYETGLERITAFGRSSEISWGEVIEIRLYQSRRANAGHGLASLLVASDSLGKKPKLATTSTSVHQKSGNHIDAEMQRLIAKMELLHSELYRSEYREIILSLSSGLRTVKIDPSMERSKEAISIALQRVEPRLISEARDRISKGEIVTFGSLGMSKEGIAVGRMKTVVPYSVAIIRSDARMLRIMKKGSFFDVFHSKAKDIPNLPIFLCLVGEMGCQFEGIKYESSRHYGV